MKKTILAFIIGGIVFSFITATAAYVYTARDINYQPSDENWSVNNVQEALTELKTDVNNINNKVEGIERVYKAGEVELVALVADDSFYTDSNGKYVLSNSNTGRTLLADTETYKSLPSTDDCVGVFEEDTCNTIGGTYSESDPRVDTTGHTRATNIKWVGYIYLNASINLKKTDKKIKVTGTWPWNNITVYIDGVSQGSNFTINQEFDLSNNSTFSISAGQPCDGDRDYYWNFKVY